ncbi:MAG: ferrous iron transporter B [Myxococcales bacterium]|nr:MAG: ferrous iron transporter B [Myxococcales bacterium]
MARVGFVIDRIMRGVGLHGKAFIPMLGGLACAVPAVMATRTIESRRDRLLTMLVIPVMSCSARLPVYVLITAVVFAPSEDRLGFLSMGALALFFLYAFSTVATLLIATVLRRTILKGPKPKLLLELPPYRKPAIMNLLRNAWDNVRAFLGEAGTIILAMTVVMWALLSYPKLDAADYPTFSKDTSAEHQRALVAQAELEHSFAGRIGKGLEPIMKPLGFDWRISVGILGAFVAREVFVSTLGTVFGLGQSDENSKPLRASLKRATWPDGRPLFPPLAGFSLMIFFVFACQCMSTIAVVKRESGSWKWPMFMFAYMTVLAYSASFAVYQLGKALGVGLS